MRKNFIVKYIAIALSVSMLFTSNAMASSLEGMATPDTSDVYTDISTSLLGLLLLARD